MSDGIWSVVFTSIQRQPKSPNLKAFRPLGFNPYLEVKHTEADSSFSRGASEYN